EQERARRESTGVASRRIETVGRGGARGGLRDRSRPSRGTGPVLSQATWPASARRKRECSSGPSGGVGQHRTNPRGARSAQGGGTGARDPRGDGETRGGRSRGQVRTRMT